ncbi:hypothetical protein AB7M43_003889 [Bradyrhizobium elkanii]
MRDPPPVFGRGVVLLAGELLAGVDVPEPEFRLHAPVALACHAAGHQRLRVDALPVVEVRRRVDVDLLLEIGGLIDRREQSAALQVVGDHLRDADADFSIARRAGGEVRDRDRHRRELALGDGDPLLGGCGASEATQHRAGGRHSSQDLPAARTEQRFRQSGLVNHRSNSCS